MLMLMTGEDLEPPRDQALSPLRSTAEICRDRESKRIMRHQVRQSHYCWPAWVYLPPKGGGDPRSRRKPQWVPPEVLRRSRCG